MINSNGQELIKNSHFTRIYFGFGKIGREILPCRQGKKTLYTERQANVKKPAKGDPSCSPCLDRMHIKGQGIQRWKNPGRIGR